MLLFYKGTRTGNLSQRVFSCTVILMLSAIAYMISVTNKVPYRVMVTHYTNNVSDYVSMVTLVESRQARINTNGNIRYSIFGNVITNNTNSTLQQKRQGQCDNCFQHSFTYIIENHVACESATDEGQVDLLILVTTSPAKFDQRQALRDTWLTHTKNNTGNVRHVFLLGQVKDRETQEKILTESKRYNDVLQESFIDSYENLTYKTIMGFKWASLQCRTAKFVLKTDDDMFVNVPAILKVAKANANLLKTHVVGNCLQRPHPIRNKNSKWYTSVESFPGKLFNAGYCAGTGYLTSLNVVKRVFEVSPNVPFFHLEDVYVGFCIRKLGLNLKALPGFHKKIPHRELKLCQYKTRTVLTSHNLTADFLRTIWAAKCR